MVGCDLAGVEVGCGLDVGVGVLEGLGVAGGGGGGGGEGLGQGAVGEGSTGAVLESAAEGEEGVCGVVEVGFGEVFVPLGGIGVGEGLDVEVESDLEFLHFVEQL